MIQTQLSHLPSKTDAMTEFPRWITQHCNQSSIVLDVGAGEGINGYAEQIRSKVGRLVGVDPSSGIELNPYLDERYHASIEDFAQGRGPDFDCLYAMFVLEHVTHPQAFLSACRSLLKPGGMLFGLTPNLWHYFGMATKFSSTMGIEEWLLERLVGTRVKAAYHFPTTYRLNSIRTIKRMLEETGFRDVEFRYFDSPHRFEYCFPKPLRWFPSVYSRLVYTLGLSKFMGIIMFRATA